ncbi:MAG TPA: AraC family transcriptional regulator [Ruminiclostridium sp.]|nr:AraC family transcriptional regulator [Ruminiclostridium sp.]
MSVNDGEVVLDVASGIALLYVAASPNGEGLFFLLDKTVILKPGIFFHITALYGSCTYQIGYRADSISVDTPSPISGPLGLSSNISIPQIHTLFYQEKEKGFSFKGEAHDFWELTYVDKGRMYTLLDGKTLSLEQGEAIFYNCGQYHTQWSDEDISVSFITVTFDMAIENASIPTGVFSVDNEMRSLLGKIIYEKENYSIYSEDMILCYLKEFVIKLVRYSRLEKAISQQDNIIRTRIDDDIMNRCLDFIEKNIEKRLTVADVAKAIPISTSYLSSIFKKKINMTVIDYINNFRLEKSKELIKMSSLNFTQISEQLGYNSVHYFSRQFKLKYGISPSEFARSIKQ